MNEDYTLTTFAEPITALADDPQLPPDEMKRRLQAPADELRQAHNALARTVKGITDATYPDTVTRAMLTQDVRDELDGKADADDVTAVSAAVTAEQSARTADDNALDTRLDTVETALLTKCEVYSGSYTGNGAGERFINIGFTPDALLLCRQNYSGDHRSASFALNGFPGGSPVTCTIEDGGFRVYAQDATAYTNVNTVVYLYLAFRFTKAAE